MSSLAKAQNMNDASGLYEAHIRDTLGAIKVRLLVLKLPVAHCSSFLDSLGTRVGPSIHHTVYYSAA